MHKTAAISFLVLGLVAVNATASDLSTDVKFLSDAVRSNPHSASAWRALGHVQFLSGHNELARTELLMAMLLNPTEAKVWLELGFADIKLGRSNEGVAAVEMARRLHLKTIS
ncbi:MAG: tetratricopeptide repeat protein [Thiobacillaceae bacterium]